MKKPMYIEEFFNAYAGRKVNVNIGSGELIECVVIGYMDGDILLDDINKKYGSCIKSNRITAWNKITYLPETVHWLARNWNYCIPISNNIGNDDCLECGAVGEECCKDDCPNKENI